MTSLAVNLIVVQGPFSRKSRKVFGSEKPFVKLRPAYSIKLVFVICCKENKKWNNCKVSCLEAPSFWRYKENLVPRNAPEKFRDFRETGPWFVVLLIIRVARARLNNLLSHSRRDSQLSQQNVQKVVSVVSSKVFEARKGSFRISRWKRCFRKLFCGIRKALGADG